MVYQLNLDLKSAATNDEDDEPFIKSVIAIKSPFKSVVENEMLISDAPHNVFCYNSVLSRYKTNTLPDVWPYNIGFAKDLYVEHKKFWYHAKMLFYRVLKDKISIVAAYVNSYEKERNVLIELSPSASILKKSIGEGFVSEVLNEYLTKKVRLSDKGLNTAESSHLIDDKGLYVPNSETFILNSFSDLSFVVKGVKEGDVLVNFDISI